MGKVILFAITLIFLSFTLAAENTQEAVVARYFYPENKASLENMVDGFLERTEPRHIGHSGDHDPTARRQPQTAIRSVPLVAGGRSSLPITKRAGVLGTLPRALQQGSVCPICH